MRPEPVLVVFASPEDTEAEELVRFPLGEISSSAEAVNGKSLSVPPTGTGFLCTSHCKLKAYFGLIVSLDINRWYGDGGLAAIHSALKS